MNIGAFLPRGLRCAELDGRGDVYGAAEWDTAKEKPVHTTVVTVLGLVAAGVLIWAALRYELLARGQDLIGLN